MAVGRSYTLSELARRLDAPQHQLIHLCEKGVVVPDVQDAHGRGSSRVFSPRNVLEMTMALRLRAAMLPVAAVGAVVRVLGAFESQLQRAASDFSLPGSLRDQGAPDLRVIISDGRAIYCSLGEVGAKPKLFGGIPLERFTADRPGSIKTTAATPTHTAGSGDGGATFGGPEGSEFVRLELSVTEVAQSLPLD